MSLVIYKPQISISVRDTLKGGQGDEVGTLLGDVQTVRGFNNVIRLNGTLTILIGSPAHYPGQLQHHPLNA